MRIVALALAGIVALPALVHATDSAPPAPAAKTKRVCHFVDTGNPMQIERKCTTVVVKEPAVAPSAVATPDGASAQVALQSQPHR